jgi:hypothetical protein
MQEEVVGGKPNQYEEQRNWNVQHLKKVFQDSGFEKATIDLQVDL